MRGDLTAQSTRISSGDGTQIEAYAASPLGDARRGGVVVIHHLPGYDRATKEMVRRFAEMGYDAVCPNLYSRQAPGADPDDAAATVRAQGGIGDEQLLDDVAGAAAYLRSLPTSKGRSGSSGIARAGGRPRSPVADWTSTRRSTVTARSSPDSRRLTIHCR
jgi:carboxymethylenebutenolidase